MWNSEATVLGQTEFWRDDKRWPGTTYYLFPGENDYLDALETDLANDLEKLNYLRMRAWWAGNDRLRDDLTLQPADVFSERAGNNMKCLYESIDVSNDGRRIIKAELARELGLFEEAKRLLSVPIAREYRHVVKVIVDRAEQHDQRVAEVHGNEAVTPEEIQAIREREEAERKARYYAPPWDHRKPRLEQFFRFDCPRCLHSEEIGLWYNSKTCSKCPAVTVIFHPNASPVN